MKKIILSLLIGYPICTNAQDTLLFNNGSLIQINGDALVQINGDFINEAGSSYVNYGTVSITGNFTNRQVMASPFSGLLKFDGAIAQTVSGTVALWANDVEINNPNGVTLNDTLRVEGIISFVDGIVSAPDSNNAFWMTSTSSISSTNAAKNTSHVNGYIIREGLGSFSYPVGDGNRYQRVDINLSVNSAGIRVKYDSTNAGLAPYGTTGSDTTPLFVFNNLEYWNCTPLGTATGVVSIFWDDYRNGGTTNPADLRVAHKSGGSWLNEGTIGIGTSSAGFVSSNSLSTWSPFTLGSISFASPLPLHLLSFKGAQRQGYNQLDWEVVNEEELKTYELQRSTDGVRYEMVTTIMAQSLQHNNYSYNDLITFSGNLFYRLKMQDLHHHITYSNTVRFQGNSIASNSTVFPNPAQDNLFLSVRDKALIGSEAVLYDIQGKRLQEIMVNASMVTINLSYCSAGTYTLRLANGEVFHVAKTE